MQIIQPQYTENCLLELKELRSEQKQINSVYQIQSASQKKKFKSKFKGYKQKLTTMNSKLANNIQFSSHSCD